MPDTVVIGGVSIHAGTHVTAGGDTIADAIAAGNSGLMPGTDKTKLNGIQAGADVTNSINVAAAGAAMTANNLSDLANAITARGNISAAASGTNADITSTTALTQITRATGGTFDIAIGSAAGDDFTIDTNKLVVEGDTGNVGIGTTTPGRILEVYTTNADDPSLKLSATDKYLELGPYYIVGTGDHLIVRAPSGKDLYLSANGTDDDIVVKSTGNVGIGTTNPGSKLEVADGSIILGRINANGYLGNQSFDSGIADLGQSGELATFAATNGEADSLTGGEIVYLYNSAGALQWKRTDADAEATSNNLLGVVLSTITTGSACANKIMLRGIYRNDTLFALTPAAKQYLSATAGDLTETAPSGTGQIVRIVGYAISTDILYFNPDNTWIVRT